MHRSQDPSAKYPLYRLKPKGVDSTDDEQSPEKGCQNKNQKINKNKYKT